MMQKLAALTCFVLMAGQQVDARQNLGRMGNTAHHPVDLTNKNGNFPPLKQGHGIQVDHKKGKMMDGMFGEKRRMMSSGDLSTELEIGTYLQE